MDSIGLSMKIEKMSAKERSRLRYQAKQSVKFVRDLVPIDSQPLRQSEIKSSKSWFRKIDQLENAIFHFQETDLKLFEEWHRLTFRLVEEQLDRRRDEFKRLADFHNQMIFLSQQEDILLVEAYKILVDEELRYEHGDEKVREEIIELRAHRLRALRERIEKENECDCAVCQAEREARGSMQDDDEEFDGHEFSDEADSLLSWALSLPSGEIRKLFKNHNRGMSFLIDIAPLLLYANHIEKMTEIWSLAPTRLKKMFNQLTKTGMGESFDQVIKEAQSFAANEAREKASTSPDEMDPEDFDFQFTQNMKTNKVHPIDENQLLELTSVYRKIVRKIHPDQVDHEVRKKRKAWFDHIWTRSQLAKEQRNLPELKQIYHKILAAFQEYSLLNLSELREVSSTLSKELGSIKMQAKELRVHPAWKFSQKKDLTSLEKKLAKPYMAQLADLNADIDEMLRIRASLKTVAEQPARPRPRRSKPSSQKRRSHQSASSR